MECPLGKLGEVSTMRAGTMPGRSRRKKSLSRRLRRRPPMVAMMTRAADR
jgi:hypothetical protein